MANNGKFFKDGFIPLSENNFESFESNTPARNHKKFEDDNRFKRIKRERSNIFNRDVNSFVPWLKRKSYSHGVVGLHEEIIDFYKTMSPTKEEKVIRNKVIEHLTRIVHSLWPQAKVDVFGSSRTGLYLPTSDIDMVVSGKWEYVPLFTLKTALIKNGIKEDDITVLANATVPMVRLIHSWTKIKIDISFNVRNGVKSAKMIKEYIRLYPALPNLILVLKQFLIHRGLNEVYYGGMSSYTLTILIISFLQGHHRPKSLQVTNLGMLLIEFFELYGIKFNYDKVSLNISDGGSYRPKKNPWESYLSIVDPLCEGNDIAKGTYLMFQIKTAFENAYSTLNKAVTEMYDNNRPPSILKLILDIDPSVFEHRHWLEENYYDVVKMFPSFDSDSENSDLNDSIEISLPAMFTNSSHKSSGSAKNKSRLVCNSPTESLRTEFENGFEKLCSPRRHAKQEHRVATNRNRAPFNAKDSGRYKRNSAQMTKNCDRK